MVALHDTLVCDGALTKLGLFFPVVCVWSNFSRATVPWQRPILRSISALNPKIWQWITLIAASHKTHRILKGKPASLLSITAAWILLDFSGLVDAYNKKLGFLNLFGDALLYITMKMIIGQEVGRLRANKSVLLGDIVRPCKLINTSCVCMCDNIARVD